MKAKYNNPVNSNPNPLTVIVDHTGYDRVEKLIWDIKVTLRSAGYHFKMSTTGNKSTFIINATEANRAEIIALVNENF